jgi:GNAT superfamily N-acetyltransferase
MPPLRDEQKKRIVGSVQVRYSGSEEARNYNGTSLEVDEEHRRNGIATRMYKYVEGNIGKPLRPEFHQDPDGKAFWRTHKWRS